MNSPLVIYLEFNSPEELKEAYEQHISKGGYFVPTEEPSPRTTPVELRFSLPGLAEPYPISGEVAFAATPDQPIPGMGSGMAIQFNQMTEQIEKVFKAAITIAQAEGMGSAPVAGDLTQPEGEEYELEEEDEEGSDEDDEGEDEEDESEDRVSSVMATLNMQSGENLYFTIRKMPLHQKVIAAKRGNRSVRNILLQEGNKKVLRFMLQNPQVSTPEVIQMLKMPNIPQEIIKVIAKSGNWSQSEEVKFHIVSNPKTPLPQALKLLSGLNQNSLGKLAKSGAVKAQIKSNALKLLEQRRSGK